LNRQFSKEVQMSNKYMKKQLTSLDIKAMQTQMTLSFYLIPARMAIIKKTTTTNASEDVGEKEPWYILGM
jgi:hypothetical protein